MAVGRGGGRGRSEVLGFGSRPGWACSGVKVLQQFEFQEDRGIVARVWSVASMEKRCLTFIDRGGLTILFN